MFCTIFIVVVNSLVDDLFERITAEASNKRSTIISREIETAVSEGTEAVAKYTSSKRTIICIQSLVMVTAICIQSLVMVVMTD